MVREVFVDEWVIGAFNCWIINSLLLWSVGRITKKPIRGWRIIWAGLAGGLYFFWFRYRWELGLIGKMEAVYLIVVSIIMLLMALPLRDGVDFLRTTGLFYLLTVLTVAISSGAYQLYQFYSGRTLSDWQSILINIFVLFFLSEVGWGIVHQTIWERSCLVSLRLQFNGQSLRLTALLDTGNLLIDPLTNNPVVLVEADSVREIVPEEVLKISESIMKGENPGDLEITPEWAVRVRFLSFVSVGKEKGFLLGIRPDKLEILRKKPKILSRVLIGLYHLSSTACHSYQALLPASLLAGE